MFLIGCNYWASESGCEMWRRFNPQTIEDDFKLLSDNGIKTVRVFPVWRDFQPIKAVKSYQGQTRETVFDDGKQLDNVYGLCLHQIENFIKLCDIAQKYGLKLIVSIVTGWMSGVLLIPEAFQNLNLLTDPYAVKWTRLYVNGFVKMTKQCGAVYAWEIGNECECMGKIESADQAYIWIALITDAIRTADATRPIFSGISDNGLVGKWSLRNQAEYVDAVTPHLYYTSANGGTTDKTIGIKTTYIGAAMCDIYTGISGKPALLEEIGTLNEIYASPKTTADCLKVNLLECWAKGAGGFLWWCAFDQTNLEFSPYDYSMRELGLFKCDRTPKPAVEQLKYFSDLIYKNGLEHLSKPKANAVCVLPFLNDFWKTASSVAVLGYQNSMNIVFKTVKQKLPVADIYIVPCITGWNTMPKETYYFLLRQVYKNGAKLYVSNYDGVIENITEVFGIENDYITDAKESEKINFEISDETIDLDCYFEKKMHLKSVSAKVLAYDKDNNAIFTENAYGMGKTYFLSFPLENMLWGKSGIFNESYYKIYSLLLGNALEQSTVHTDNSGICVTEHILSDDRIIIIAVNHTETTQKPNFKMKKEYEYLLLHGDFDIIPKCDATIMLLEKKKGTHLDDL